MYVDNAALQVVLAPKQFDVIVTSNMFGDILSDGAAGAAGSLGLIPSMSWGLGPSLYEPIHGSAPSIAGRDVACPIGAISSAAMLLRESFGMHTEANAVESAIDHVLESGMERPILPSAERKPSVLPNLFHEHEMQCASISVKWNDTVGRSK